MTIGAGWYLVHEIFVVFTRITEKVGEARTGDAHIHKAPCLIPEIPLDKETILGNG